MCDCITRMNVTLSEHGLQLSTATVIQTPASAETVQREKILLERKSGARQAGEDPRIMIAAFCPFCGERHENIPNVLP